MQVYVELVLVENFCMDFTLLYCAKRITKNRVPFNRLIVPSLIGALVAVVAPLLPLNGVWGTAFKICSGAIICLFVGGYSGVKEYLLFFFSFLFISFLLGGGLIAIFSLSGSGGLQGDGYFLSQTPVGIPLFFALQLSVLVKKISNTLVSKNVKNSVRCRICLNEREISIKGFFDSGNKVYYFGSPVNIIPRKDAEKLVDIGGIKTFAFIHTVAGDEKIAVFTADSMEIDYGNGVKALKNVKMGVSIAKIDRAILHLDMIGVDVC